MDLHRITALVCGAILTLTTTLASASEPKKTPCSTEFANLQMKANEAVHAARLKARGFTAGDQYFPFDVDITFSHGRKVESATMQFRRISALDKNTRNLLRRLKKTGSPSGRGEIEVGAWIAENRNGQKRAAEFTSKKFAEIDGTHFIKAFDEADLIDEKETLRVIHVHTHPRANTGQSAENAALFSDDDIEAYRTLSHAINKQLSEPIEFLAYLLPNCEECDDVVGVMVVVPAKQTPLDVPKPTSFWRRLFFKTP